MIVHALATLVLDDATLVVERRFIEICGERSHAIALEPKREIERIRRHRFEVVRAVGRGGGVDVARAGFGEVLEVVVLRDVLRTEKCNVLDEVREPALALRIVACADVKIEIDCDRRRAMIFVEDDRHAVRENELRRLERNADDVVCRSRARRASAGTRACAQRRKKSCAAKKSLQTKIPHESAFFWLFRRRGRRRRRWRRRPSQRAPAHARREWFTPRLALVLAATVGATVVLAGTDVAVVASLRELHHLRLTGVIFLCWGIASIAGGLAYGAAHREVSPMPLLIGLGLLTVPLGAAHSVALLSALILLAGLFCAPTLTATASAVSGLVPESARGEAMGWHGSALTIGSAIGAPLSGWAIDRVGAWGGFAAVGLAGAVLGCLGVLTELRLRQAARNIAAHATADTLVN